MFLWDFLLVLVGFSKQASLLPVAIVCSLGFLKLPSPWCFLQTLKNTI